MAGLRVAMANKTEEKRTAVDEWNQGRNSRLCLAHREK